MLTLYTTALANANEYARQRGSELLDRLGYGQDGIVYSTDQKSAVKAFRYDEQYRREKEVYGRIEQQNISKVGEFAIPKPISCHDKLMVIEMEIVSPPLLWTSPARILTNLRRIHQMSSSSGSAASVRCSDEDGRWYDLHSASFADLEFTWQISIPAM